MKKFEELLQAYGSKVAAYVDDISPESTARLNNARAALLDAIREATQAKPCQCEADAVDYVPFDASKVTPGDTIQVRRDGVWIDARYVGPWVHSSMPVVVQHDKKGFFAVEAENARMAVAREMRTVYLNIYANAIVTHDTSDNAEAEVDRNSRAVVAYPVRIPKV